MALVLEVEYLAGVAYAAVGPDSDVADWPPQPDRIFSALVATWAARGRDEQEAAALEWLEQLPPPSIYASSTEPRGAPTVFVPPNDPGSGKAKHARSVLPALRSRQGRRFPASRPYDPVVRLSWQDAAPAEGILAALERLARDTSYVGHSASLTRCRFTMSDEEFDPSRKSSAKRRIYRGRLAELRRRFEAGLRPLQGDPLKSPPPAGLFRGNVFGARWIILEHVAGEMPDLRAAPLVAKAVRDTLLNGYQQIGLGDRIPDVVSGHSADGRPTRAPHLAVVPLPFAGFSHADGHVMGFALIPPHPGSLLEDEDFRRALRKVAPLVEDMGRRILRPRISALADMRSSIALSPTFEPPVGKRTLDPELYTMRARTFATLTPIVLDRHLKKKGAAQQEEIREQITAACGNIGLPEPDDVVADKHSAMEGAASAYPSGSSPRWMRWRLPDALQSRRLTHAVIRFKEPVDGPVILGAGRFVGLGLCRPIDAEER